MIPLNTENTTLTPSLTELAKQRHYYGDVVRRLLIAIAAIMLLSLPFFLTEIAQPLTFSLTVIILLILLAGLFSPLYRWLWLVNIVFSAIAMFWFQYYAADYYQSGKNFWFFGINEALALLSLCALYFSVKTLRGFYARVQNTTSSPAHRRPLAAVWLRRGERR